MSCQPTQERKRRPTTLPPPCYHCKPPPFRCPNYGCPPPQQCPTPTCRCPPASQPFVCRPRPEPPPRPPTLCIAGPCPKPPGPPPYRCPPGPKVTPPPSCIRYCLRTTCGETTYSPCYFADAPKCPRTNCC